MKCFLFSSREGGRGKESPESRGSSEHSPHRACRHQIFVTKEEGKKRGGKREKNKKEGEYSWLSVFCIVIAPE